MAVLVVIAALASIGLLTFVGLIAWLVKDYRQVRGRAFNGQVAFQFLNEQLQKNAQVPRRGPAPEPITAPPPPPIDPHPERGRVLPMPPRPPSPEPESVS